MSGKISVIALSVLCTLSGITAAIAMPNSVPIGSVNTKQIGITGKITDKKGEPLIGVTIKEKGSKTGASTDVNGNFKLQVSSASSILVISYIGYKTLEYPLNSRTTLSIILDEDSKSLDEVVVVGYGTQKKSDFTGAVSSVTSKTISETPVASAAQAIQGRVAGVDVTNNSGRPGDAATIRIRGNRSITAGNNPLYVIDGIPMSGSINTVNPADIESMEILKDASATAIYGSRGANGVILITTKRGTGDRPVISYDPYYGFTDRIGSINMLSANEYASYRQSTGASLEPYQQTALNENFSTDWQSPLFQQGYRQNHPVSVRGASGKTKYLVSGEYFNEKGVVKKSDYTRYGFRANLDQEVGKKVKLGVSSFLSYAVQNYGIIPNNVYLQNVLILDPLSNPFNVDGTVNVAPDNQTIKKNPYTDLNSVTADRRKSYRVFASAYGEYQIAKGLSYRLNAGVDNTNNKNGTYNSVLSNNNGLATAGISNGSALAYTVENLLNFKRDLNGHSISATGLFSIQSDFNETSSTSGRGIPYDSQLYHNIGTATEISAVASDYSKTSLMSYMGRLNYSYKSRYLATLTMRADGSSRLAPGRKWGYFPSVALGWRLIEEPFLKDITLISELKLRGSYGVSGNTGINPYSTQGSLSKTVYAWDENAGYGYSPSALANGSLSWEKTASSNIGLDFGFLKNRISGSVEVYEQNTSDLLLNRAIPAWTGFSSVLENVGKTRNRGIELSVSGTPVSGKYFRWSIDANAYANRESIIALNSGITNDIGNGWFTGKPIKVWYDYQKNGIWQSSEVETAKKYNAVPGDVKLVDLNNDEKINADFDRKIVGNPRPKWGGGVTNRFSYRGADLSFFVYIRQGQTIYSQIHERLNTGFYMYNNLNVNYWTPQNNSNEFPRPTVSGTTGIKPPLYYFDGSFIRLQNVSLGYSLPKSIIGKSSISNARIYVTGNNLWTIMNKKIPGYDLDPETSTGEITLDNVLSTRLIMLGLNLTF
ncbi:SusC/RagA family TonB-linked outer membrane protein [Desertivirga brevis]|uniref:SusC/RagA family TonB-linked outer membrane protein n=1 Tax=Desertivirga brevis TaxID=2810310 RepID=UPI001A972D37|nr:TonB-dependent receptor [Pedobacter sp. SYSU D00873]